MIDLNNGNRRHLMRGRFSKIARSGSALLALLVSAVILAGATPAPRAKAADFFKPQEQLESFEVYHIADGTIFNVALTLERLISSYPVRDYARTYADNRYAAGALYSALNDTVVFPDSSCDTRRIDVRWAIVLNYNDHTKTALGFNRLARCLQVSSRQAPIAATSGMVEFVDRTFGFMR